MGTTTLGGGGASGGSGAGCPEGRTRCSFGCADLMFDNANCGIRGNACPAELGQQCLGGTCGCFGDVITCDDGRRVSASFPDPTLCGGCEVCSDRTECIDGVCR